MVLFLLGGNMEINFLIKQITSKNHDIAYNSYKELLQLSSLSSDVSSHLPYFFSLLNNKSSYNRTRALNLIIENARWDNDRLIDKKLDLILNHLHDEKPTVSRNLIQNLPKLAQMKEHLIPQILTALKQTKSTIYNDTMQPLIQKDIESSILELQQYRI